MSLNLGSPPSRGHVAGNCRLRNLQIQFLPEPSLTNRANAGFRFHIQHHFSFTNCRKCLEIIRGV